MLQPVLKQGNQKLIDVCYKELSISILYCFETSPCQDLKEADGLNKNSSALFKFFVDSSSAPQKHTGTSHYGLKNKKFDN